MHITQIETVFTKLFFNLTIILSACLVTGGVVPAHVLAQDGQAILQASVLVPRAVGQALAGSGSTEGPVVFAKPVQPDPYLVKNGFRLERVNTAHHAQDRLQGGLTFGDAKGRRVHQGLTVDYKSTGKGRFLVSRSEVRPITPAIPASEAYIVPAEAMTLKQMQSKGFIELLDFARSGSIHLGPDTTDPSPKEYHVLVFVMDRLQSADGWILFADTKAGSSWGKDGWMVAATTTTFAVNGPEEKVFRVFYAPGKGNVLSGKVLAAAAFTNRYQPPLPLGPADEVQVSEVLKELKTRYAAKAIPSVN